MKRFLTRKLATHPYKGFLCEIAIKIIYTTLVRHGDVVIDGGANAGVHTQYLMNLVGESGICYSIEPLPFLSDRLNEHYGWLPQVRVLPVAIGNASETRTFFHVANDNAYSGLIVRPGLGEHFSSQLVTDEIRVRIERLDSIIPSQDVSRVTFIKLDLEGGEFDALQGADGILRKVRPVIVLEQAGKYSADAYGYTEADFFNFFDSRRYNVYTLLGLRTHSWRSATTSGYNIAVPSENVRANFYVKYSLPWRFFLDQHKRLFESIDTTEDPWQELWL